MHRFEKGANLEIFERDTNHVAHKRLAVMSFFEDVLPGIELTF